MPLSGRRGRALRRIQAQPAQPTISLIHNAEYIRTILLAATRNSGGGASSFQGCSVFTQSPIRVKINHTLGLRLQSLHEVMETRRSSFHAYPVTASQIILFESDRSV